MSVPRTAANVTNQKRLVTSTNSSPGSRRVVNQIPPPHLNALTQQHLSNATQVQLQSIPCNNITPNDIGIGIVTTPQRASNGSGDSENFGHFLTEHEIKFTRTEVCTPSNCISFFIAFLFSFMAILSGIYYGLNFFDGKQIKERVFKAQFVVFDHDLASSNLDNIESAQFQRTSTLMKQQIEQLFRESTLSRSFIRCEIVAFERRTNRPSEVTMHFNIHMAGSAKQSIESADVYFVIAQEISQNRFRLFDRWNINHDSLDVQERKWASRDKSSAALLINPWAYKSIYPGMLEGLVTEPTPAPRRCMPLGLSFCRSVGYNKTSYPNMLNHWNLTSLEEEFITYKEIIDSECYALAKEFICIMLQPECINDKIIQPCQSFCNEFFSACQRWLPKKVADQIVCGTFPNDDIKRSTKAITTRICREKPNCVGSLRSKSQEDKICDAIRDCSDGSDEYPTGECNYCGSGKRQFHCGDGSCIPADSICDGLTQCQNGADEYNCLLLQAEPRLISSISLIESTNAASPDEGYIVATYRGKSAFVCAEAALTHMRNYSHIYYNNQLQILGLNICNDRHFEELIQIESKDIGFAGGDGGSHFAKFIPGTTLISPHMSQCKNREIYFVQCAIAKCGISGAKVEIWPSSAKSSSSFSSSLSHAQVWRKAFPSYWPWFVKVNLNGNYLCDGTLISSDAVLLQSSCFGNSAESSISTAESRNLSVTLGSVRAQLDNVDAIQISVWKVNTIIHPSGSGGAGGDQSTDMPKQHLARLIASSNVSRYVRPVCHNPDIWSSLTNKNLTSLPCVLLRFDFETDQLQSKLVQIVSIDKCDNTRYQHDQHKNYSEIIETKNNSNSIRNNTFETYKILSSTSSFSSSNLRKLCVHDDDQERPIPTCLPTQHNAHSTEQCAGGGNGRHLFCQIKFSWHLLAVESAQTFISNSTNIASDVDRLHRRLSHFVLFNALPQLGSL